MYRVLVQNADGAHATASASSAVLVRTNIQPPRRVLRSDHMPSHTWDIDTVGTRFSASCPDLAIFLVLRVYQVLFQYLIRFTPLEFSLFLVGFIFFNFYWTRHKSWRYRGRCSFLATNWETRSDCKFVIKLNNTTWTSVRCVLTHVSYIYTIPHVRFDTIISRYLLHIFLLYKGESDLRHSYLKDFPLGVIYNFIMYLSPKDSEIDPEIYFHPL